MTTDQICDLYRDKLYFERVELVKALNALDHAIEPADIAHVIATLNEFQHSLFIIGAEWSNAQRKAA